MISFDLLEEVIDEQDTEMREAIRCLKSGEILTNKIGNKLRSKVSDRLSAVGFVGEDYEPTSYGLQLEDLIDAIGRRTQGM